MLEIPLTFPNSSRLRDKSCERPPWGSVIEQSFLSATPTALEYWEGCNDTETCGIVVGCEDGSLYVFGHFEGPTPIAIPSGEQRKRRPRSPLPFPSSRGATNPSTPVSTSFSLSFTRPRTVSGVTIERVEAPKNFVDFDDEPDRLKDILQGRNPNPKGSDTASISAASPAPSIAESLSKSKRKSPPRRSLSIGISGATTPRSFSPSSPHSPHERSHRWSPSFSLRYHIIPSCSGPGHAVRAVQILEGNQYIAVLHQPGDLSIYSTRDGECVSSISVVEKLDVQRSREIWTWCSLKVGTIDGETLLLVTAATDSSTSAATPDLDEASSEKSLTVAFLLADGPEGIRLEKLGRCDLLGPARGIGIYNGPDESTALFSIDAQGQLLLRPIELGPPTPHTISSISTTPEPDHLGHLALAKSIKAIMNRSPDHLDVSSQPGHQKPRIHLLGARNAGVLLSDSTLTGLSTRNIDGVLYGIVWAHREMTVFSYNSNSLQVLLRETIPDIEDAEWLDNTTYALSFKDKMEVYALKSVDADNNSIASPEASHETPCRYRPDLVRILPTGPHEAGTFIPSSDLILTKVDKKGNRTLVSFHVRPGKDSPNGASTVLWQPCHQDKPARSELVQTATLPIELETIVQGYSDGRLRQFTLEQMIVQNSDSTLPPSAASRTSEPSFNGCVLALNVVQNKRTREKYVVGGVDDGSIAFWSLSTLELCARWIAFCSPLVRVIAFDDDVAGILRGCVLCIAADGTIAVIVVDGFQFLYLIPGSFAPLNTLCIRGSNLLLIYGNQLARTWDLQAKEFHRSMTPDKAQELLDQDEWLTISLDPGSILSPSEWRTIAPASTGRDSVATLAFALERFVQVAVAVTRTISTSKDEVETILRTFDRLRLLLAVVLTPGLSPDLDSVCSGKLNLPPAIVGVGLSSLKTTTLYSSAQPQDPWCISGNVSASRLLAIVYVTRALSLFEDAAEAANAVIGFYTTSLGPCIGPKYCPPSLEYLAKIWFPASNELRQSIRTVFDATLAQLTDQQIIDVAEKWQQYLPYSQPDEEREDIRTAIALFICGFIAAERFSLLSVSALLDISKSVALYFHDENSTHRVLAIDLCSKGFHVWQQYVDTLEILRSLFMLATTTRKASISPQNVGAQARLAVLSIAAQNTALFMSTLCVDILEPSGLEHRRSVMQIIAFLIRKRPLTLRPHIPRLMEAVVKSLDPNSTGNREAVLGAATEIIGYVVKTFPTVDFHMGSQKLAVGTSEGAVVMYDLKTAIRLYVLEGHRQPLTALNFSPDGRRLVTVSLTDQHVLVWKVGTGFSSFFAPGLPPRQGHGGSEPFKKLPFNIGLEGKISHRI
ncbi:TFIID and SAGA subunit, variant 2 [Coprinopsis cinerea AmutBmut pab1-1]|nr:TFIID and SAGA subunit, variant 2 [Coprinopsis cinerea AmutBmut pab1-1]